MSRSQPVRALNVPFQISATRPAFVSYVVSIACETSFEEGSITLRSSRSPAMLSAIEHAIALLSVDQQSIAPAEVPVRVLQTLTALILPGHFVELIENPIEGTPVFSIVLSDEVVL